MARAMYLVYPIGATTSRGTTRYYVGSCRVAWWCASAAEALQNRGANHAARGPGSALWLRCCSGLLPSVLCVVDSEPEARRYEPFHILLGMHSHGPMQVIAPIWGADWSGFSQF